MPFLLLMIIFCCFKASQLGELDFYFQFLFYMLTEEDWVKNMVSVKSKSSFCLL
uniref:Uncharacterized protein n=1 Tax=Rhizophora mucronata TaxID=61149 RepID=A0A2P2L711_RHIMU